MSTNYKNWVPNGMITALTAGTAILRLQLNMTFCLQGQRKKGR